MNPVARIRARSALFAALGLPRMGPKREAEQALDDEAGDLAGAFARRLGIPTKPRPPLDLDAGRVVPNRAARRAELRRTNPELWRSDVKASYSRRLYAPLVNAEPVEVTE